MTSSGTSSGTGIIMSSDGYVITNHHVISGALVISVLTNDNREFEAAAAASEQAITALGLRAADVFLEEFMPAFLRGLDESIAGI